MTGWHFLPAAVYSQVEQSPGSVLLESSPLRASSPLSRLFLSPLEILAPTQAGEVAALFERIERAGRDGHFAAGYFAYECGACFEPSTQLASPRAGEPLAWFGIYERCHVFDHSSGAFLQGYPAELAALADAEPDLPAEQDGGIRVELPLSEGEYSQRIEAIHAWIRAGDVYQLNYTFPLRVSGIKSPAALFVRLRSRQPVEYAAFLHTTAGRHILSLSPELFFHIEDRDGKRRIVTRPMKGTARRGRTNAEDAQIAARLSQDEKNRSENVMIVDLLRNDLGRLCTFGSVRVEDLFRVERYDTLWQMTSTVSGELRPEASWRDVLRALFPCGSVTGAPKVRAMQILAQLEGEPRGVYTGAIGYFSREQTVFNVAIRTLEVRGGEATMGIGSGVVIDSVASDEFRECRLKAEFLTRAEHPFQLIETMRWQEGYPLLPLHLDRLEDSAHYFGFGCNRAEVETALIESARAFDDPASRKVRLTLSRDGDVQIGHELLEETEGAPERPPRVYIAKERTDPDDRFLFHKTTNRALYAKAFKAARDAGYADVLFLNGRGQVTESAIGNIFIECGGRWYTPPTGCGLLAGVYRRHLLETRPEIEERVLTLDDLRSADAVYVSNAVRGLQRVRIDW